jgi:hypothetical protein
MTFLTFICAATRSTDTLKKVTPYFTLALYKILNKIKTF